MLRDKIKRELRLVQESKNVISEQKSNLLSIIGEMSRGYSNSNHPMYNYSNEEVAEYFNGLISKYLKKEISENKLIREDFAGTITHLPQIDGMLKAFDPNKGKGSTEYIYPRDYKKTGEKLSITFYDKSNIVKDFGYPYLIQLRENNDSIPLWTKVYNWLKSKGAKDTKVKGDDRYGKVTVLGLKDKNAVMKITNDLSSHFLQLVK